MKWMIAYVWILSLIGAFFYGNEFGMIEGQKIQKQEDAERLKAAQEFYARIEQ